MGVKAAVAAGLACLLARAAGAREVPIETLRRFEMPPYTFVAASEAEARQAATYAAEVDQVLHRKYRPESRLPTPSTTLLLLSGKQVDRYLADKRAQARRGDAANTSNYLLLPAGAGPRRLQRAVYHQLAHLYARTQFEAPLPFWFEEGFALMVEALRIDGREAVLGGQRFSFHDRTSEQLREGNRVMDREGQAQTVPTWISLSRVFSCDESCGEYSDEHERHWMRREQWAVVHRAMIGEAAFGKQVTSYLELWRKQVPVEQALKQSFGDVGDLDRSTRTYASRERLPVERVPFDLPAINLSETDAFRPDEVEAMRASLGALHWPAPN